LTVIFHKYKDKKNLLEKVWMRDNTL
jgi:hypothetical protein